MTGPPERPGVLLLATTRSYNADDFARAAEAMGIAVTLATDRCHVLAEDWPEGALALDFRDVAEAARQVEAWASGAGPRGARALGIVATDEVTAQIAARAAAALGLPHNPPEAARRAADKLALREALAAAGLPQPRFVAVPVDALPGRPAGESGPRASRAGGAPDPAGRPSRASRASLSSLAADAAGALVSACRTLRFPVVVKPRHLSASRGVMRADDPGALADRAVRLADILRDPEVVARDPDAARSLLIEEFVPGCEVAVEGVLRAGVLQVLAITDKPEPLDGPVFAETLYVTPSEQPAPVQAAIARAVADAAAAVGLREGPVHAELRLAPADSLSARPDGVDTAPVSREDAAAWPPVIPAATPPVIPPVIPIVLELAARSIGGLCSRALRFGAGVSLEAVILAHAIGRPMPALPLAAAATGVAMLPVPARGVLRAIAGVDGARAVPGVREVTMTARVGDAVTPLPEGASYLGFVFADGASPAEVTRALCAARARIRFDIAPLLE